MPGQRATPAPAGYPVSEQRLRQLDTRHEVTPISPSPPDLEAGLCARCAHHLVHTSARGSTFHRCGRADDDQRFPRYPPIPVARCDGFEPGSNGPDARAAQKEKR